MNGILLSIASGIGFGVFQALNRRAGRNSNPYQATFVLLLASSVVLTLVSLLFEDLSLLQSVVPLTIVYFTLAAVIHFVVGWTLFSISQQKVGAARTGVLLGTVPLWAIMIGVVLFAELLSTAILLGILLMIVGAYVVSTDPAKASGAQIETGLKPSLYGLGTAVCFAVQFDFYPLRTGTAGLAFAGRHDWNRCSDHHLCNCVSVAHGKRCRTAHLRQPRCAATNGGGCFGGCCDVVAVDCD